MKENQKENVTITSHTNKAVPSSLRYPKCNLELCLEKIKILFLENAKNAMYSEGMSKCMGFSGTNGSSDSILASLKYYGLLEQSENNKYKVAEFIIDSCIDKEFKKEDIKKCLLFVPVNRKLFGTYDIDNLPGVNEIKSFLIKECNYSLKDVTRYIEIFNANSSLYKNISADSTLPSYDSKPGGDDKDLLSTQENDQNKSTLAHQAHIGSGEIRAYNHPLQNGKYITIQLPQNIKDLDLSDLEDAADLLNLILGKVTKRMEDLKLVTTELS